MRKIVVVMICLWGLAGVFACSPSDEHEIVKTKPRAVHVEKIVSRDLPLVVRSVGRLVPNREVVVSAEVTGILNALNADVGSKVELGTTLVKLDPVDYNLAINEAQANLVSSQARLAAAHKAYERAKHLLPAKAISEEVYDQLEAEYRTAKAQVTQLQAVASIARQRLSKTVIRAPFDGFVTQKFVEIGQNIAVGDPVMSIADMATMRVKIYINENDYVNLDQNDPVTVLVEAFSNTSLTGTLSNLTL